MPDKPQITEDRYEVKMVLNAMESGLARAWVYQHPFAFYNPFPPRFVNNIYFDTLDNTMYESHKNGEGQRSKFRLRWYGETYQAFEARLEIKQKNERLSRKMIHPLPVSLDIEKQDWRGINAILIENTIEPFREKLRQTRPAIINRYFREYFSSADEDVRITLDSQLQSYRQSFGFYPNLRWKQQLCSHMIIEFKSPVALHQKLAETLAFFPLYCSAYSKYQTGGESAL